MGANAQTAVPTFTTGQVLTADQMNQSARTGVPVFADTTARDAAFGGSGEKTLAEGQLCYLEDSNIVQYYDGAAWATVGPSTASALTLITKVSFTSQTSVAFANSIFTATYSRYLVQLSAESTLGDSTVTMQVRDNSTTKSTSNYNGAVLGRAADGTADSLSTNNGTAFSMGRAGVNAQAFWSFHVTNPTSATLYTTWTGSAFLRTVAGTNVFSGATFGGMYEVDQAHTGLVFNFSVAATGQYNVYGLVDA